GFDVVDNIK
nr:RecName: Full=Peroxidase 1 [Cycas revoluta]P86008.1 RecName: Full=Peroxidase 9 [Capsicum annuum]